MIRPLGWHGLLDRPRCAPPDVPPGRCRPTPDDEGSVGGGDAAREEMRLSDLELVGDLGAGGFARVSKACHHYTGAVFALKMPFFPDPDMEKEEAEVIRRTAGSPHVVDCHTLLRGPRGETAFLLEFIDAGSLGRIRCRRRGRGIPKEALAEAAVQCVVGLAQLHSRGVAHLDVKPDNLLANARGEIKIFSSRILCGGAGERLEVLITCGTSSYFSPERFAPRARVGPHDVMAADVWSLGITVLELFIARFAILSGEASFEELKQAICHGFLPEGAKASPELHGFVAACLQKDPGQRAMVPQLLRHPFLTRRHVEASRRALLELILETL